MPSARPDFRMPEEATRPVTRTGVPSEARGMEGVCAVAAERAPLPADHRWSDRWYEFRQVGEAVAGCEGFSVRKRCVECYLHTPRAAERKPVSANHW